MDNEKVLFEYIKKVSGCNDEIAQTAVENIGHTPTVRDIIFNHDNAKRFFGEVPYFRMEFHSLSKSGTRDYMEGGIDRITNWQYHLQNMVLCENPLEYLAKFLEEK